MVTWLPLPFAVNAMLNLYIVLEIRANQYNMRGGGGGGSGDMLPREILKLRSSKMRFLASLGNLR